MQVCSVTVGVRFFDAAHLTAGSDGFREPSRYQLPVVGIPL